MKSKFWKVYDTSLLQEVHPKKFPSLAAWYKSNTGVTIVGAGVDTWADQSGNGNDLRQTTDANRPVVLSNQLNGYPSVSLVDNSDLMTLADNSTLYGTSFSIYVVASRNADLGASQPCFRKGTTGGSNLEWAINAGSGDQLNLALSADGTTNTAAFNATGATWSTATFKIAELHLDSGTAYARFNNTVETTASFAGTLHNGAASINLGAASARFDYVEILYYTRALSPANRSLMRRYLARKYVLTIT